MYGCEICKTSSYICIEVNDKHGDRPPNVMMQNTEYFGLYRNSNIRCDVTPTSRIQQIIMIDTTVVDVDSVHGVVSERETL